MYSKSSRARWTRLDLAVMYPTPDEEKVIAAAEMLMVETMARYDPSHDAYHGECRVESLTQQLNRSQVQRVRKTALTIARNVPGKPDLLVIELGASSHPQAGP